MFPIPWSLAVIYWLAYAATGLAIGAFTGWLVSMFTRRGPQGIVKDAFLGSFGYIVGFIGCISMPWPRNTFVEQLEGGGTVTTTMYTYQHPGRVAIVVAVILPFVHELYRFRRRHAE